MQTMTFDIQGMTCGGCIIGVQRALQKMDGVSGIQVSLRPGQTTLNADPLRVSAAQIESAISTLGFQARFRPSMVDRPTAQ